MDPSLSSLSFLFSSFLACMLRNSTLLWMTCWQLFASFPAHAYFLFSHITLEGAIACCPYAWPYLEKLLLKINWPLSGLANPMYLSMLVIARFYAWLLLDVQRNWLLAAAVWSPLASFSASTESCTPLLPACSMLVCIRSNRQATSTTLPGVF